MSGVNKQELRRLAESFPADLDWDSNTEPFFNGPSGESLGGGADGTYTVYGKPFRLDGEECDYDGPTYVERCGVDFAKFMVEARDGVLGLIAEIDTLRTANQRLEGEVKALREALNTAKYRIEQGRVWNGMGWSLTGLHPHGQQKALDAIEAALRGNGGE